MALTTLDTVNSMLALMGELPVNSLEDEHPLVPSAMADLAEANAIVQADMWWFNVEYPTLIPQDGTGQLLIPSDAAQVDSLTEYPRLAVRGIRVYNLDEVTDVFTSPLRVRLHRILPFDDVPIQARAHIAARAKLTFQLNLDGDQIKAEQLNAAVRETYARLNAEHIRSANTNMLKRSGPMRMLNEVIGYRTQRYGG